MGTFISFVSVYMVLYFYPDWFSSSFFFLFVEKFSNLLGEPDKGCASIETVGLEGVYIEI